MKRLASVLLLLLGVALLAGCMRVDGDLTISPEDTVSGKVTVAVDREWATSHGSDPETMFAPILQDLQEAQGSGVSAERYESDGFVGLTLTLRHTPLERISAATSGVLQITKAAGEYQVNGDFTGLSELSGDGAIAPWQLELSITFPNGVTESDGEISGSTVTWHLDQGAKTLHARGPAPGAGVGAGWLAAIGAGIVVLAGGAWWLLRSRRGGGSSPGGGGPAGIRWFAGLRRRLAQARSDSGTRVSDLHRPKK